MVDITKSLKDAINTGKVHFGIDQTRKAVADKTAKLVIISRNPASETAQFVKEIQGTKTYKFGGTNVDLGLACGKPFPVSVLAVVKEGDSQILTLGE